MWPKMLINQGIKSPYLYSLKSRAGLLRELVIEYLTSTFNNAGVAQLVEQSIRNR